MLDFDAKTTRPSLKLQLRRLKDQYPCTGPGGPSDPTQAKTYDPSLPQGQAPDLAEQPQITSAPSGTVKEFQDKKLSYKDLQYGLSKRGR